LYAAASGGTTQQVAHVLLYCHGIGFYPNLPIQFLPTQLGMVGDLMLSTYTYPTKREINPLNHPFDTIHLLDIGLSGNLGQTSTRNLL
jgi:hypothetical protein